MKERPILFSGAMVRALLAGTKTQTRRVIKPQHLAFFNQDAAAMLDGWGERPLPYGQAGDRLWVRESFGRVPTVCGSDEIVFAADYRDRSDRAAGVRYTPSIHMPRAASRITLEITSVRVERLQDISEADAQAEGTTPIPDPCDHVRLACADIGCIGPQPYRVGFRSLWQDINGPTSWDANPWVWVVEFRRLP